MKKYEYMDCGWTFDRREEYDNVPRLMAELNKLGAEGWQLVHSTMVSFVGRPGFQFDGIFMREIEE